MTLKTTITLIVGSISFLAACVGFWINMSISNKCAEWGSYGDGAEQCMVAAGTAGNLQISSICFGMVCIVGIALVLYAGLPKAIASKHGSAFGTPEGGWTKEDQMSKALIIIGPVMCIIAGAFGWALYDNCDTWDDSISGEKIMVQIILWVFGVALIVFNSVLSSGVLSKIGVR